MSGQVRGVRITPSGPVGPQSGEVRLATDEGDLSKRDEAGEVERLRAEVTALKTQLTREQLTREELTRAQLTREQRSQEDRAREHRPRRHIGWRAPVATVLIVLGCVLAPISVLGVWTSNQVSNTDRYVTNVAPLIGKSAVRGALTDKISSALAAEINVQGIAKQAAAQLNSRGLTKLGGLIGSFSGSIASGVNGLIHSTVAKIVSSQVVARIWVNGNRFAHTQLVKALSGKTSSLSVSNGKVVIGLGPIIDQAKHRLAANGLTVANKLPEINPTFPLFSAKYLVKAQSAYRLLNTLKWALPLLTLLLLAAGIYVARRHRRTLIGAGLGLAASMIVLGAGLAIARAIYLNKVPNNVLPADAAAVVFDTLVRFIRQGLRVLLVLGLLVALAGFITGPSITAVRTRQACKSGLGWVRGTGERAGLSTGPVGTWVYRYRMALRIAAAAVAGLIFVFWTDPTGAVVLVLALLLVVVIGLIELIGRPPTAAVPASASGPPDSSGPPGSGGSPGSNGLPGSGGVPGSSGSSAANSPSLTGDR